jgi:hypothetical protein
MRQNVYLLSLLGLATLFVLFPARRGRVVRDTTREIALLESAECEYNGIKTTLGEMTRAYALTTYEKASFVRWEARPNPDNPETETLVTGIFMTEGVVTSPREETIDREVGEVRRKGVPSLGVTWRVRTLAGVDIAPHNRYAHDAIAVYRRTVDGFIDRMVVVTHVTTMREGPGNAYAVIKPLEIGTVLLHERQEGEWVYVRIPSTTTEGWVGREDIRAIKGIVGNR